MVTLHVVRFIHEPRRVIIKNAAKENAGSQRSAFSTMTIARIRYDKHFLPAAAPSPHHAIHAHHAAFAVIRPVLHLGLHERDALIGL